MQCSSKNIASFHQSDLIDQYLRVSILLQFIIISLFNALQTDGLSRSFFYNFYQQLENIIEKNDDPVIPTIVPSSNFIYKSN